MIPDDEHGLEPHEHTSRGPVGPTGLSGPPGPRGPVIIYKRSKTAQVLFGLAFMLFFLSLVMSQIFAWNEVAALRRRVNQVVRDSRQEQTEEDCLTLYRNDLTTATAEAIAANNNLWVSVAGRPPALTDEERVAQAEENARLGEILAQSNKPLQDAVDAIRIYIHTEPKPEMCPHPMSAQVPSDTDYTDLDD
jgi:hypothetical protein